MSKHAGSSAQAEPRGQPLPSSPFPPAPSAHSCSATWHVFCLQTPSPLFLRLAKWGAPTEPTPHRFHKPRWSAVTSLRGWTSCLQKVWNQGCPRNPGCHCSCRPLSQLPQWGLQSYRGLRALIDLGFSPCVTLSQAFDLSAPQFPHTSNGHNKFVEL